jgi:hypothetical protein
LPSFPAGENSHATIDPPEQLDMAHPTPVVEAQTTCVYALYIPAPTASPSFAGGTTDPMFLRDGSTTHALNASSITVEGSVDEDSCTLSPVVVLAAQLAAAEAASFAKSSFQPIRCMFPADHGRPATRK